MRITLFELWNGPIWTQLSGLGNAQNILDIFKQQVKINNVTVTKIIKRPTDGNRIYTYHGCVITDVDDGETINLGTTILPKGITIMYTKRTWR